MRVYLGLQYGFFCSQCLQSPLNLQIALLQTSDLHSIHGNQRAEVEKSVARSSCLKTLPKYCLKVLALQVSTSRCRELRTECYLPHQGWQLMTAPQQFLLGKLPAEPPSLHSSLPKAAASRLLPQACATQASQRDCISSGCQYRACCGT